MSSFPHPGISVHKNQHDITVLKLHYDADPDKAAGNKVYVKEIDRWLSPWALDQYRKMTDPNLYLREFEIEAEATLGRLIFNLDEEATCEDSFPIDPRWTRRMALDPHPSVPHAFLWVATDPWGDRWYYREFWPSKACFLWDGQDPDRKLLGKAGPCPDDEPVIRIRDFVQTLQFLESAENAQNTWHGERFDERLYARVIDYAARAFGQGTSDDPEQPNFQKRFEQYMIMPDIGLTCPYFEDAKKDRDVGFEMVNAGLKSFKQEVANGVEKKRSKIHIFRDRCPELIYQLKNIRREVLTPTQMVTKDPSGKAVNVRAHLADCLRYIEMSNPVYVQPTRPRVEPYQQYPGIAY
jgi:hypothetical protein